MTDSNNTTETTYLVRALTRAGYWATLTETQREWVLQEETEGHLLAKRQGGGVLVRFTADRWAKNPSGLQRWYDHLMAHMETNETLTYKKTRKGLLLMARK